MTVSLRQLKVADDAWLDSWLAPAAAGAGAEGIVASTLRSRIRTERGARAWIIERAGASVGVVVARIGVPQPNAAIVELVATPPAEARRGAGMAAAAMIEPSLRRAGVRRVFAPAAAAHGIAVYFWIRLGYRPLSRGEWPCAEPGVAWFGRDL